MKSVETSKRGNVITELIRKASQDAWGESSIIIIVKVVEFGKGYRTG